MPSTPEQAASIGEGARDGHHGVDLDPERGHRGVVGENNTAAGERAEQVGRRARGEVLAAEGRRQVGVPVEGTGRAGGPGR